jgi:hypothetical protein
LVRTASSEYHGEEAGDDDDNNDDGNRHIADRCESIIAVIEDITRSPYYADITRAICEIAVIPMIHYDQRTIHGDDDNEAGHGRWNPAFIRMEEHARAGAWLSAVHWFVVGFHGNKRHLVYPHRDLRPGKYPGFEAWMREFPQRSPSWSFLRLLFCGASSTRDLCGLGYSNYANIGQSPAYRTNLLAAALEELLGRDSELDNTFDTKSRIACYHGNQFEDMAREIYVNLTGNYVFEIGMGIMPESPFFSQSPDGLCPTREARDRLHLPSDHRSIPADTLAELCRTVVTESDPMWRVKAPNLSHLIEIKMQYKKVGTYEKCPGIYIAQLLQGMYTHGVDTAHFVSAYYAPHRHDTTTTHDPSTTWVTIEEIRAPESIRLAYCNILRECERLLAEASVDPTKPLRIPRDLARSVETFEDLLATDLVRSPLTLMIDGQPCVMEAKQLGLVHALGSQDRADYWKTRSAEIYMDTKPVWDAMPDNEKYKCADIHVKQHRELYGYPDDYIPPPRAPRAPMTEQRAREFYTRALKRIEICRDHVPERVIQDLNSYKKRLGLTDCQKIDAHFTREKDPV